MQCTFDYALQIVQAGSRVAFKANFLGQLPWVVLMIVTQLALNRFLHYSQTLALACDQSLAWSMIVLLASPKPKRLLKRPGSHLSPLQIFVSQPGSMPPFSFLFDLFHFQKTIAHRSRNGLSISISSRSRSQGLVWRRRVMHLHLHDVA